MGILVSRFKRKKTALEILESLEKRIKSIEGNQLHTEQKQRKIVGHLILYSVGVYIIAAVLFYFLCFPASLQDQLFYITPLLIFPIIVILVKRLVTWYYRRKLTHSQEKLHDMREKKKKLLEDVMDNETYKVAKEILEKFAPDQLQKSSSVVMPTKFSGSRDLSVNQQVALAAHNTSTSSSPPTLVATASSFASLKPGADVRRRLQQQPPGLVRPPVSWDPAGHYTNSGQTNGQGFMSRPTGPPMPRPILPRDRSYLDKLVEYLVGDGPSNRYALICKQCRSHNGMALKEEFEYLAFRCCYCFYWNPARKQRPQAPRLPAGTVVSEFSGHTSSSEVESASDTEEESGSDQSHVSESTTKEGGIKISEAESVSDQSFVAESTAEEDGMKMSEAAAAEGQVQLEPDVSQSTDDKPFSSDTADTETTEISDS